MNKQRRLLIRAFLIETAVYAVFVVIYILLVLRFMSGWLKEAFDHDRPLYAAAALLLMLGQGVVLEAVTSGIFRFIKGRRR